MQLRGGYNHQVMVRIEADTVRDRPPMTYRSQSGMWALHASGRREHKSLSATDEPLPVMGAL